MDSKQLEEIFGFYSTYEELKLDCFRILLDLMYMFLQYLWGIETLTPGIFFKHHSKFLQYLWGIETNNLEQLL